MPIIFKHGGKCYEIADDVLARSAISKAAFQDRLRGLERDLVANGGAVSQHDFLDLSDLTDEASDAAGPILPR